MGVSAQLFRIRIGTFTLGNQLKYQNNDKASVPKTSFLKLFLLILLVTSSANPSRPFCDVLPRPFKLGDLHQPLHLRQPVLHPPLGARPTQLLPSLNLPQYSKPSQPGSHCPPRLRPNTVVVLHSFKLVLYIRQE